MARTKGSHDIAPQIRGAFLRAVKYRESKGKKSLSELIDESLDERFLETLKAIATFVPKEMLVEADITSQMDELSDEALNAEIKRLAATAGIVLAVAGSEEPREH